MFFVLLFQVSSAFIQSNNKVRVNVLKMVQDNRFSVPIVGLDEGMGMTRLSTSDLTVSEVCLGTMMFGDQLSKEKCFQQLDFATKKYGVNFIDTAEIYPTPSAPSTTGKAEKIIGQWLRQHDKNKRKEVVISAKICGFSNEITWCRKNNEPTRLNKAQIVEAVDSQLERLGTDYIDLLQFHWPDRYVPMYGSPEYDPRLEREDTISIREQLEAVDSLVKSGKVRHFGLSNETPYGATTFLQIADLLSLPRPVVVQNPYNLLERNDFESGMMEVCSPRNGNIGLLAYSPLAGGALTGKYTNGKKVDPESRLRKFVGYMHRYLAAPSAEAIREYQKLADYYSLPLSAFSLAFVYSNPFVASTIIAATSLEQLEDNILSLNLKNINEEMLSKINSIYRKHLDPTKGRFPVIDPNMEYDDPSKLPWGAKDYDVDPELDVLINQRLS